MVTILTKLSFSVDLTAALSSHFPDGRALYRDPSLSFPLGWGFPLSAWVGASAGGADSPPTSSAAAAGAGSPHI
jgi:hypothetical protein